MTKKKNEEEVKIISWLIDCYQSLSNTYKYEIKARS
jgi:hypothetical protein